MGLKIIFVPRNLPNEKGCKKTVRAASPQEYPFIIEKVNAKLLRNKAIAGWCSAIINA